MATKSSIVLKASSDWPLWYRIILNKAEDECLLEYVKLVQTKESSTPAVEGGDEIVKISWTLPPKPPVKPQEIAMPESDTEASQREYEIKLAHVETAAEALLILSQRLSPTAAERVADVRKRYNTLLEAPKNWNLADWLDDWPMS
ncbi:hypothetical protein PAAG_03443 [Paracoccidioides lutzii Pb01]|uniref:Uncharacterized protein n=1 Tax=Paracoccidioides lutzii (strain ATCC MYA-826 / Pb01) TaxID=502779 RepID=C1GX69_PARBA|nr:hypothetical protein PAAG_03443 [Paracoccidioides lutzii Pb01]EEH41157.2 hypothetical protein PAAG_03443 [Paracoccidioides lutzii Pb01]